MSQKEKLSDKIKKYATKDFIKTVKAAENKFDCVYAEVTLSYPEIHLWFTEDNFINCIIEEETMFSIRVEECPWNNSEYLYFEYSPPWEYFDLTDEEFAAKIIEECKRQIEARDLEIEERKSEYAAKQEREEKETLMALLEKYGDIRKEG
jgi:uncharacterized Zn-finger protein